MRRRPARRRGYINGDAGENVFILIYVLAARHGFRIDLLQTAFRGRRKRREENGVASITRSVSRGDRERDVFIQSKKTGHAM